MSKGYYREISKRLQAAGYAFYAPAKGSHEKWLHNETRHMLIVPRNCPSPHTANQILKDAGLPKQF